MLKGVDISEYQPNIDINSLKSSVDFIIIRSSYGDGYTDKFFENHANQVRQAGIPCGFYHYAYPQYNSPQAEAAWFLQTVKPQKGELLCLDFEEHWSGDPVAWCKEFLDYVSNQLNGYKPLLYINLATVRAKDWSPVINSGYGLWLADWDNNDKGPGHDTPWSVTALRQYTDQAKVSGIPGNVDADIFYGDLKAFKAYGYQSSGGTIVMNDSTQGSKVMLPIQPLSQRDSRWVNQRLGTVNGTTLGGYGCIVTDMAMLSTYYGHPILPNVLDDTLTNRNLYYDGNLFVNQSINAIFSDIYFDKVVFCETTPAPIDEIIKYLDAGKPTVVALINQGIRHYILVVGYEGDRIYCNDPWMGDNVAINDRWGDPKVKILQVNFFSGPVPIQPEPYTIPNTPIIFTTPVNIPQPPVAPQPVTVSVPPVDTSPIQIMINQGLAELQNSIGQLAYTNATTPTVPSKSVNQIFIDSLKSRKLILTMFASMTAFANSTFKLSLTQDQLMIVILPILSYLLVEGGADIISRLKTTSN